MEPFAAGYLVMIGAAAVLGVFIGAIGGALGWRLRLTTLALVLSVLAFVLYLFIEHGGRHLWLGAELIFGLPPLLFAFLAASISARSLAGRTSLRPGWVALLAFGIANLAGALCLLLFRIGPGALLKGAISADLLILVLLVLMTRRRRG